MIVADTSAMLALIDADDHHHKIMLTLYEQAPADWILPWAVLPEIDYMLATHVGIGAQRSFLQDLAAGNFAVEWGNETDLTRAHALCNKYRSLRIGIVDATVATVAERLGGTAIATLDLRHFGALTLAGSPRLVPRDA